MDRTTLESATATTGGNYRRQHGVKEGKEKGLVNVFCDDVCDRVYLFIMMGPKTARELMQCSSR